MISPLEKIKFCTCCGSNRLKFTPMLWDGLIQEWELMPDEVTYIDFQQGIHCLDCESNLRSMALAKSIMIYFDYDGLLHDFIKLNHIKELHILEINEAGHLTKFFSQTKNHQLTSYPDVDMSCLPYPNETFDLIIHSDTLEHVDKPVQGLSECYRVLKPGSFCAFTVPIIIQRLTRSRAQLEPSYHGRNEKNSVAPLVHTEYGSDVWTQVIEAGFQECRIFSLAYPSAQAIVGVKSRLGVEEMENTGERYIPRINGSIRYEHLHRYAVALQYVVGKCVLDLASGEGYGSYHLSKVAESVIGVDIDAEAVSHAQRTYSSKSNLYYHVGSCSAIPLPDNSIDVVTSFETIEHHNEHEEMMIEIKRVLKPNGLLIISSPNKLVYSDNTGDVNPFHVKELYLNEFSDLLGKTFKNVEMLGQKMAIGSFIAPIEKASISYLATLSSQKIDDELSLQTKIQGLYSPVYFIALCSDFPLLINPDTNSIYIDEQDMWGECNAQIADAQLSLHNTAVQFQQVRTSLSETELDAHRLNLELQATRNDLEKMQHDLEKTQNDLNHAAFSLHEISQEVVGMKNTKFWKIRERWVKLKRKFSQKSLDIK